MLETIDRIYEAAMVPDRWIRVLTELCDLSESWAASLVAVGPNGDARSLTMPEYQPAYDDLLASGLSYKSIRTERYLELRYSGFQTDLDVCGQQELDADPIYQRLLYPRGIGWTMGSVLPIPTGEILVFDFARLKVQGPFQRSSPGVLNPFRPHLARAALLTYQLKFQQNQVVLETLSALGIPGAVLDRSGKLISWNGALDALQGNIQIGAGKQLRIRGKRAETLFQSSIVGPKFASELSKSIPVPKSGSHPALILHILPIRGAARDFFTIGDLLLVVTPVVAPRAPLTEILNGLFDLTPAEARLAKALASGTTTAAFANEAKVSKNTIKTQLKAVFDKTGTSRQVDLISLLGAASPIGRSSR